MGWFARWRRGRAAQRSPVSPAEWSAVIQRFSFLRALNPDEQGRLRDLVAAFLNEKSLQGAGGLTITRDIELVIAAQACLLVLNLDLDYYRDWVEVIVYPDEFIVDHEVTDEDGVVHRVRAPLSGEAWEQGPVILSWVDAEAADGGDGYNVVMHEFAHKIDMLNGAADGFPPLHAGMDRAVLDAYGWGNIPTDCEFLLDYEIDEEEWGSKKKPYRYRWPDEVRDEVLARLLELNAERAKEEAAASKTAPVPKPVKKVAVMRSRKKPLTGDMFA